MGADAHKRRADRHDAGAGGRNHIGPLTTDQYGYLLLDSQNVSYSFGQNGYQTPQLMEMNWSADVRNDELSM